MGKVDGMSVYWPLKLDIHYTNTPLHRKTSFVLKYVVWPLHRCTAIPINLFPSLGTKSRNRGTNKMNKHNWSDDEMVALIKKGDPERNQALRHLFERLDWKGAVIGFILNKGGDPNDAKEIAVLALQLLDHNIRHNQYKGGGLKTYFMSIAKFQWYKMLRNRKPFDEIDTDMDVQEETNIENYILNDDWMKYIEMATGVLGKDCKAVFRMKGMGFSNEVVAERLGLANANMAKKKHYRCRKKFTEYLSSNPHWKDLLSNDEIIS